MSHFTVAVFTDDAEAKGQDIESQVSEALAPFQENNMCDCPSEYLAFEDCTDEVKESWEDDMDTFYKIGDLCLTAFDARQADVKDTFFREVSQEEYDAAEVDGHGKHTTWRGLGSDQLYFILQPGVEVIEKSTSDRFEDMDDFANRYHGYSKHEDKYGYWENPNAKWDWWSIGGRWQGILRAKPDAKGVTVSGDLGLMTERNEDALKVSSCLIADLDTAGMVKDEQEQRRETWRQRWPVLEKALTEAADNDEREALIKRNSWWYNDEANEDEYAASARPFGTYALLYDGQWGQKGEMGWWCISTDEISEDDWQAQFDTVLKEAAKTPTMRVTIVDCHI